MLLLEMFETGFHTFIYTQKGLASSDLWMYAVHPKSKGHSTTLLLQSENGPAVITFTLSWLHALEGSRDIGGPLESPQCLYK